MTAARAPFLLPLAALLLAGCADVVRVRATSPVSGPGGGGAPRFLVEKLSFEVPDSWAPRGDARRLDVQRADRSYTDESECLAQAEVMLEKGAAQATNVRRHPTTFAGRKGVALEGDQAGWHGWAWGVCDGAVQYRVSFWGATPLREDVLAAWKGLSETARFEP